MFAVVESVIRLLERWWGMDEVSATMAVGVMIGSSLFSLAILVVVCACGAATKPRQTCMGLLLGTAPASASDCTADKSDASRTAASEQGRDNNEGGGPANRADEEQGEEAEPEVRPEGGYRSDSASDDEGEGARVDKLAQRRARKCRGV